MTEAARIRYLPDERWEEVLPLVQQLIPDATPKGFRALLPHMVAEGKRCVVCEDAQGFRACAFVSRLVQIWCGVHDEVEAFVVDESVRGQGYGRQLLLFIEEEALKDGVERVLLKSYAANHKARQFYERYGFRSPGVICVKALGDGAEDWDAVLQQRLTRLSGGSC